MHRDRARDEARRNARARFAMYREDGTPVGSFTTVYADGCSEHSGTVCGGSWGPDHEPDSHTPDRRVMRGLYRYDDDYDYGDDE